MKSLYLIAVVFILLAFQAGAQTSTPCSSNLISILAPCMSSVTRGGGSSPTQECCQSLHSLVDENLNCACLLVTGNVPLSIPSISNSLAVSLPKACGSSVPLQCKAASVVLPPGAAAIPLPSSPPPVSESSSGSKGTTPTESPAPASHSDGIANPRIVPVVTPESSSAPCTAVSEGVVVLLIGLMGLVL